MNLYLRSKRRRKGKEKKMSAEDKNEIEEDIVFESNTDEAFEDNDSIVSEADMILGDDGFDDIELNEEIIFGEHDEEIVVENSEEKEDDEEDDFSFYSEDKSGDIDDQISAALSDIADTIIEAPTGDEGEQFEAESDEDKEFSMVNAALASQFGEDIEEAEPEKKKKKSIVPMWLMVALCIVFGIAIAGGLLVGTSGGRKLVFNVVAKIIAHNTEHDDGLDVTPIPDKIVTADGSDAGKQDDKSNPDNNDVQQSSGNVTTPSADDTLSGDGESTIDEDLTPPGITGGNTKTGEARHEDGVYNILLLGEESIGTKKGRTDAIIIATMDTMNNKLKLSSITRDILVTIDGYSDNSINTVYAKGGIQLVYKVIEKNFHIKLDGYVLVDFECFEDIVDVVGGVDIKLTEEEANYLNTTNYISEEKYRTMVPGVNHMNGNQALGYCRVRKVSTSAGEGFDFGRTARHRDVMMAVFEKCKTLNMFELSNLMLKVLSIDGVKTDITENMWSLYLEEGFELLKEAGGISIEEKRIPVKNGYEFTLMGKREFTILDWEKNLKALHEFIFGNYIE